MPPVAKLIDPAQAIQRTAPVARARVPVADVLAVSGIVILMVSFEREETLVPV